MLVILPFEKEFYETKWDYKVEYVGHPLAEVVKDFLENTEPKENYLKPVIAILPGSRKQEISAKLPVMLQVSSLFPNYQFVVAKAASVPESFYQEFLPYYPEVASVRNKTYNLLAVAKAAIVTSGTATLETALFQVPQVVCYKGSPISYHIAKRLIKIKYISLVNLIMDREVVKELIQHEMTAENIGKELSLLLHDPARQRAIRNDYHALKTLLEKDGNASRKAAESIVLFTRGQVRERSSKPV
jgi:lipid-A-disaccharide synthase